MRLLADEGIVVYQSPDPQRLYVGSPTVAALPGGRIAMGMDLFGPGAGELPGPLGRRPYPVETMQAKTFVSDDRGATWRHTQDFPMMHARLFAVGGTLYYLGHCGRVMIARSMDGGLTWSETTPISEDGDWTQAPANVWFARGCAYLVMMKITTRAYRGYFISVLAPVLWRARLDADLLRPESWARSAPETPLRDLYQEERLDYTGFPFYPTERDGAVLQGGKRVDAIGWHEAHVVQILDPDHEWYDPNGRSFHILARCENHRANWAGLAKVEEDAEGGMRLLTQTTPSGKTQLFLPLPGGQMKFHICYDEATRLYWLVSNQTTDTMVRLDRMPPGRFALPYNQRNRLQLSFSKNLVDWCMAGMVSIGKTEVESRHYCGMTIAGDDLLIASRSGSPRAKNPHDVDRLTCHRVRDFRKLAY